MPSLREIQDAFRISLVEREDRLASAYIVGDGLAPERRLAVYRNTFVGNLANALRLSYPAVHRLVGAEFFEGAAQIFVREQPPRSGYLDKYGAGFPDFLARFAPAGALAYLPDVARLEWAVSRALHAPDVAPLDVTRLATLDASDHDRVRFLAHPSVSLLVADYPVDSIWRAVLARDDTALGAIDPAAGPVRLIIQRLVTGVDVTRLDECAWGFAAALCAGEPLGQALDAVDDANAAAWLGEHLSAGRFVEFSLADPVVHSLLQETLS